MPDLRAKDGISLERCGVDTGLDLSAGAVKRADVGAEIRHCPRSSSPESTKSQHCAAPRRRKESLKTPGGPRAPAPAAQAPRSSSLRDAISERERERDPGSSTGKMQSVAAAAFLRLYFGKRRSTPYKTSADNNPTHTALPAFAYPACTASRHPALQCQCTSSLQLLKPLLVPSPPAPTISHGPSSLLCS